MLQSTSHSDTCRIELETEVVQILYGAVRNLYWQAQRKILASQGAFLEQARPYARVYIARLIGLVLSVSLVAAAARLLGPAGLGDFVIIVAGLGIGVQILNLGLSSSLLVLFSSNRSLISHQIWRLRLGCLACALILFLLGLSVESFVGDFEGPFLKLKFPPVLDP